MKKSERRQIVDKLDWEGGYEYLIYGSDFAEVTKDKKFHEVRNALVTAWKEMEVLLGE